MCLHHQQSLGVVAIIGAEGLRYTVASTERAGGNQVIVTIIADDSHQDTEADNL